MMEEINWKSPIAMEQFSEQINKIESLADKNLYLDECINFVRKKISKNEVQIQNTTHEDNKASLENENVILGSNLNKLDDKKFGLNRPPSLRQFDLWIKAYKDDFKTPVFGYTIKKVLDYANHLPFGQIDYLKKVLKMFYDDQFEKMNFSENTLEAIQIDEAMKKNLFYRELQKKIKSFMRYGENFEIETDYGKVLQNLAEVQKQEQVRIEKEFNLAFNITEIQQQIEKLTIDDKHLYYLCYLKQEFESMLYFTELDQQTIIKKYKLSNIYKDYYPKAKNARHKVTLSELLNNNLLPFINKRLKDFKHIELDELKEILNPQREKQEAQRPIVPAEDVTTNLKEIHKIRKDTRAANRIQTKLSKDDLIRFLEILSRHNIIVKKSEKYLDSIVRDCFVDANDNDLKLTEKNFKQVMNTAISTKAKNRIVWKLGQSDLIEFFEFLKNYKLISDESYEKMNIIIRDCFVKHSGQDYNNRKISKSKNSKAYKSKYHLQIKRAFEEYADH